MTARGIAFVVIAAGVIAGGIALAISIHADVPDPEAKARDQVDVTAKPATKPAPPVASAPVPAPARPAATGSARASEKHPIPIGGFAAWTGREGTAPGELEELARIAGMRIPLALEQRRTQLLEQRTAEPHVLAELLGGEPTGFMLATIGTQAKLMRDAAAQAQAANRAGTLSDDDAIKATRAAQDTYRRMYQRVTGLSDAQFEQFFAPARPLP